MNELAQTFEEQRPHLRAVAYRMLGSLSEADDAVQETWLRLSRSDAAAVDNLGGWLTTVVARICLDMLRARRSRREEPLSVLPEPIVTGGEGMDPEHEALLADAVGLALLVVLERLSPAERLAFVLHDMFGVPFDEVGGIIERSPTAARQLASRARRRVEGVVTTPDPDLARQREAVDAFISAARSGDFDALIGLLDPDIVLRADAGSLPMESGEWRGPALVAGRARNFAHLAEFARPALVNGAAGIVVAPGGRPFAVMGFTVRDGRILEIDVVANPERLRDVDLSAIDY